MSAEASPAAPPNLTVAICTHQRAAGLRNTLESLVVAAGEAVAPWELLIIANACTDDTEAVAASFVDRLPLRVVVEPTAGLSRARNAALAAYRAPWIAFTDDDALVEPDWLAAVQQAIEAHPEMDWYGGASTPVWPSAPPRWLRTPATPFLEGLLCNLDLGPDDRPYDTSDLGPFGVNLGMSSRLTETVGSFRLDLGPGTPARGEETEYINRARAAGFQGRWLASARVGHVADPSRFGLRYLYRHGVGKGLGLAIDGAHATWPAGLGRELGFLLRGAWQGLKGRGDNLRVCVVNAGLCRGLRRGRRQAIRANAQGERSATV